MTAEIFAKENANGDTEVRIKGMSNDIIPMVLNLAVEVAVIHAQKMGTPEWCSIMAMSDTLKMMAEDYMTDIEPTEESAHENCGLS